jgi:hypothetical protein
VQRAAGLAFAAGRANGIIYIGFGHFKAPFGGSGWGRRCFNRV